MLADHAKRSKPVRSRSIDRHLVQASARMLVENAFYALSNCCVLRTPMPSTVYTVNGRPVCARAHVYPMQALFMRRNYSTKIEFSHLTRPDTCSECARTFNKLSLAMRSGRAASVLFNAILLAPSAPPEKERHRKKKENSRLTLFRLRQCLSICLSALTIR